ncbi:hypothetical protein A7976_10305 [Methylobacillus sp. MM3]|uniref:nucleotidyltransferase family protein n=1 Tax=Methylobacillus sp. MM3 TaxID=1848039 RepID=UPI0007DF91E6|nr:nucleotidyltransferase family protein [Methylobacillus sp. MM3]OAJ71840.1 hypothetical protein A7976_10305 [Methylobacillus sp. MM3]
MKAIAGIVLAAGASRRFGSDKLLHPIKAGDGVMPLLARSLLPWLDVFSRQLTVVVRADSDELRRQVEQALGLEKAAAIHWRVCPDSGLGMSASLAAGVADNRDADGWVIGLADMPRMPTTAIAAVRDAVASGALLAAPYCDEQRGHPVGFAASYRNALLTLQGDTGARDVLKRDAGLLHRIDTTDRGVLTDIDRPEDLVGP